MAALGPQVQTPSDTFRKHQEEKDENGKDGGGRRHATADWLRKWRGDCKFGEEKTVYISTKTSIGV